MSQPTFFKKLLVTYLSIIIVYTFLAVISFFLITSRSNNEQWNTQNTIFINQLSITIENKLKTSIGITSQLQVDADVIKFVTQDKVDYYNLTQIYRNLREFHAPLSSLNAFIAIGKKSDNQIISPNGSLSRELFIDNMNFNSDDIDILQKYMNSLNPIDYLSISSISDYYTRQSNYITIIKRHKFSKNNEMLSYISFVEDDLIPDLYKDQKGILLILNKNKIIYKQSNGIILDNVDCKDIWNGSLEGFELFSYDSELLDWKYVYMVPHSVINRERGLLLLRSGLVSLFLIMIGSFIAFLISQKTYAPMYKIMKYFKQDSVQDITDEFEIIEKVSLGMLQANENLKRIIENDNISLRNKFLRDLLYGLVIGDFQKEKLIKYDLTGYTGELSTIILEYEDYANMQLSYSEESLFAIRKQINSIIKNELSDINKIELVELDYKNIVLIFCKEQELSIIERLEVILFNIEKNHSIKISGAVGSYVESIVIIYKSFGDALKLMEYSSLIPNKRIITEIDIDKNNSVTYYYPLEMEQNLINYILKGKLEETTILLNHILEKNFETINSFHENQALFTFAIVGTINRLLNQMNRHSKDTFDKDIKIYVELNNINNISEFKDKIQNLFLEITQQNIEYLDFNDENKLSLRILDFIHKNYILDISLLDIAEEFSITPAYVSMLFKKENQVNFKDYLNHYRITQAKSIISSNPNIKNTNLAKNIGFNSVNTFIRVFKKYEGISPGRYAELNRNDH